MKSLIYALLLVATIYYAYMTGKKPGIVLILENPCKDWVYLKRLYDSIRDLDIKVWLVIGEMKT